MQLSAMLVARAITYIEVVDLNPRGRAYYPALAQALVRRFNFQKFPQKPEDFDESKGVVFGVGIEPDTGQTVDQVIIYPNGILLDTRESTSVSKALMERALLWLANEVGLAYRPGMLAKWQYYSQLTFTSPVELTLIHPALQMVADTLKATMNELTGGEGLDYEVSGITLNHDLLRRKHPYGNFTIQRRDNIPFKENKYFSDGPVPTDIHLRMLEQFESYFVADAERIAR